MAQFGLRRGEILLVNNRWVLHNRTAAVVGPDGRLVRLATGQEGKTWTAEEFVRAMRPFVIGSRK